MQTATGKMVTHQATGKRLLLNPCVHQPEGKYRKALRYNPTAEPIPQVISKC